MSNRIHNPQGHCKRSAPVHNREQKPNVERNGISHSHRLSQQESVTKHFDKIAFPHVPGKRPYKKSSKKR